MENASSRQLPPATVNGTYGTPMNMGGRVQPRKTTSLRISGQHPGQTEQCPPVEGEPSRIRQQHAGDLRRGTDEEATDQDWRNVSDALVIEGDLVAREDDRDGDDGHGRDVEQSRDAGEEAGDLPRRVRAARRGRS